MIRPTEQISTKPYLNLWKSCSDRQWGPCYAQQLPTAKSNAPCTKQFLSRAPDTARCLAPADVLAGTSQAPGRWRCRGDSNELSRLLTATQHKAIQPGSVRARLFRDQGASD